MTHDESMAQMLKEREEAERLMVLYRQNRARRLTESLEQGEGK